MLLNKKIKEQFILFQSFLVFAHSDECLVVLPLMPEQKRENSLHPTLLTRSQECARDLKCSCHNGAMVRTVGWIVRVRVPLPSPLALPERVFVYSQVVVHVVNGRYTKTFSLSAKLDAALHCSHAMRSKVVVSFV